MKHTILPAAMAVMALMTVSCHRKDKAASAADDTPAIDVAQVAVDSVTVYKEFPGSLIANRSVDIMCRVDGTISGPLYTGGTLVEQGAVLFTIEPSTYQNAVSSAKADLDKAVSNNAYAEEHYKAVEKAYQSNAVSKMELAEALSTRDQSRSAITAAKAALDDANLNLGYCTIRAPFTGHISTNTYSGGSYISGAGSPVSVAKLYDDAEVIAIFAIEDAAYQRMFDNPNNRHLIDYSAIPVNFSEKLPHSYTADLTYLAPNVDASTGTMRLEAHIKNPYNELKAGMYCTVRMPYKVDPQAILVRDASISTDQLGKYVYVVNDSDRVVYTPIKVGDLANDSMRIVTSGLKAGDRYVTSAMLKVRDGEQVKPVDITSKR